MKTAALVSIGIVAMMSVSATAAPVMIAGTSFENEALGAQYEDTGDPTVNHALINNPGQSVVNSTPASAAAGNLGFNATFINTGHDTTGMTDGANVGVVNDAADVGYYPQGSQGYEMNNTDGAFRLIFDGVDLTAHTSATVSMSFYINETNWEDSDYLKISVKLDGNLVDIWTTVGKDIDDDFHDFEDQWTTIGYGIGDSVSSIALVVESWSEAGTEKFFIDDVRFQGEPIPEPASMAILGLGALLALRRKK